MAERGVEILCVGTELLLGSILNGNARWIAEQLAGLGLPSLPPDRCRGQRGAPHRCCQGRRLSAAVF